MEYGFGSLGILGPALRAGMSFWKMVIFGSLLLCGFGALLFVQETLLFNMLESLFIIFVTFTDDRHFPTSKEVNGCSTGWLAWRTSFAVLFTLLRC